MPNDGRFVTLGGRKTVALERYTAGVKKRPPTLPRALDEKVDSVARRLGKPRRIVLQEAIDEYTARHDPAAIAEAMNRVVDVVDSRPDAGLGAAAARVLRRSEW